MGMSLFRLRSLETVGTVTGMWNDEEAMRERAAAKWRRWALMPAADRFWSESVQRRIAREDGGCWTWTGTKNRCGYGFVQAAGRHIQVHRLAYEATWEFISSALTIDHLCENKACCNPDHLELVTLAENVRRQHERMATCRSGRHPATAFIVRPNGYRLCAPCNAELTKRKNAARPTTRAGRRAKQGGSHVG